MPSRPAPSRSRSQPGFSLIEVLGLVAVFTILALTIVPPVIQSIDRAAHAREREALRHLAESLRGHILRNRNIPDHTTFAQAIGTEAGLSPFQVLTNSRRMARRYLIDPAISATLPIPFNQGMLGVTNPITPPLGVLLLSSIGEPLPLNLTNGFASTTAAFSNIWNVAEGQVPAGWSWNGRGADLQIERLSLETLFIPLVLNYDTYSSAGTNFGRYSIDGLFTNTLPAVPTFATRYLKGTVLELHHHQQSPGSLQLREVLQHPQAFVYEGDAWRGQLFLGRGFRVTSGLDLQVAHDLFVGSPENVNAKGNPMATPPRVINALSNYMQAYVAWSSVGYPTPHASYNAVRSAQSELETITANLLHKPSGKN